MSDVHNRTRYLAGCRCDRCRKAQSDYRKDLRRRSKSKQPTERALTSVPSLPKPPAPPPTERAHPGPVEAGVRAEIEGLTAKRPGLVEGALAMARLLDSQPARCSDQLTLHLVQPIVYALLWLWRVGAW